MPSRLASAYRNELARTRAAAATAVVTAWDRLPAIDQRHMDDFQERAVPAVRSAQARAVSMTDAYMATYMTAVGEPRQVRGLDPARYGRPAPMGEVYARPFVQTYMRGETLGALAARRFGRSYAAQLALTDVTLAARGAWDDAMKSESRIVGYRRVIGPGACEYCQLASTQRYHIEDLQPLHPSCGCSVEPIVGTRDPGHVIDPERLAELKGVEMKVVQHGELGPVLYDKSWHFDTAA